MKLVVFLVTIAVLSNISISFSGNTLQYERGQHDPTLTLGAEALSSSSSAPVSQQLFYENGLYLMTVGVGTPPQNVSMVLNTGNDISWVQCYTIFNPRNSTTFSQITCGDSRCKQLEPSNFYGCGGKHNKTCLYNDTYGDGSSSQGAFSTEALTLADGTTKLRNISLGCGHDNQVFFSESAAGLLGLGRGDLSFITQTAHQFQSQFSYCLAYWYSNTSNSSIVFGPSAVTQTVAYTPLIYTNITNTLYCVNLTGISVDGNLVSDIHPSLFDGGVNIDSGTTYTQLIKEAYAALSVAFSAAIQNQINSTVHVGSPRKYFPFDTCYNISSEMLGQVIVPTVELHFDQGANITLGVDNTMIQVYNNGTISIFCLAFKSNERYTTIGNVQQQSIRIVYDLLDSRIGFAADSC